MAYGQGSYYNPWQYGYQPPNYAGGGGTWSESRRNWMPQGNGRGDADAGNPYVPPDAGTGRGTAGTDTNPYQPQTGGTAPWWGRNPQLYWDRRTAATGLGGGMTGYNPWANYTNSALAGMQGGYGNALNNAYLFNNPNLGYSTWQGLNYGANATGTNPWAGNTTNYIRRPSQGGRVPR